MTRDDMILINPPECERCTDSDIFVGNHCGNESYSSDSNSDDVSGCDEVGDDIDLFAPQDDDDIGDFVILGEEDDIPRNDIFPEYFPTTLAGDEPFQIDADICVNKHVNEHVIMNQCGSLLNRNDRDISGFRSQKYFLHRIASVTNRNTVPLLYPEAMVFPSIFGVMFVDLVRYWDLYHRVY